MGNLDPATILARLEALKALQRNAAWETLFAPMLAQAHTEHLSGISNTAATSAQRDEHLHAYHLARDLDGWLKKTLKQYEDEARALMPGDKKGF